MFIPSQLPGSIPQGGEWTLDIPIFFDCKNYSPGNPFEALFFHLRPGTSTTLPRSRTTPSSFEDGVAVSRADHFYDAAAAAQTSCRSSLTAPRGGGGGWAGHQASATDDDLGKRVPDKTVPGHLLCLS